jgi:hypothetical protein
MAMDKLFGVIAIILAVAAAAFFFVWFLAFVALFVGLFFLAWAVGVPITVNGVQYRWFTRI